MAQNILIIGATGLTCASITKAIVHAKSDFGRISVLTSSSTIQNKAEQIKVLKESGVEV